jgi:DNA-binding transcriptional ArsR family regulator
MCSVQEALDAISSPTRREILRLVWNRELPAGDIAATFEVTWAAISQNLRILREAGLIRERKEGNRRLYRADRASLGLLERVLREMWSEDLARLRQLAEAEHGSRRGQR